MSRVRSWDYTREEIWELLDQMQPGQTYRQSQLWRTLRFHGPSEWQAVIFVTIEACKAGLVKRVARGLYEIQ